MFEERALMSPPGEVPHDNDASNVHNVLQGEDMMIFGRGHSAHYIVRVQLFDQSPSVKQE